MSLLAGSQLAKSYGPDDIFAGVNLSLPYSARIALVGSNGAGKTSLLRILAGLEEASQGTVTRAKGVRVGYLPQEAALYSEGTLWEEMLTAFTDLRAREAELTRLEAAMANPAQFDAIMEKYGPLQHQFELDGGYAYENQIKQVLAGLNFDQNDYAKPVAQLSGGQKTRALLGRLLLENPDLLILDEPTNHLDIHAVEWLETWISEWNGATLIVSHDRYFLDQTVDKVWELRFGKLAEYPGNYSAYLKQRAEQQVRQSVEYAAQQELITKEEDFIRRNMAGQNSKQAKGRLRRLDRLKRDDLLDRPQAEHTLKLRMQTNLRSGDRVIETFDATIGYQDDGKVLFRAPDVLLWREECAALIGPNGAGKTTFLRTLLNDIPPLTGKVKLGSNLKIGYFAQAHEGLQPERTVMEEVQSMKEMTPGQTRDYLAKFLFTGDDVFKTVSVLSGGERGRVALAKLALEGANLLLLDEPSNHLDIPSQEILEAVLSDFPGTILLVSHDRYLIDALATQIWSLENGVLEVFKGTWSEYVANRERRAARPEKGEGRGQKLEVSKAKTREVQEAQRVKEVGKKQKADERKQAARLADTEAKIAAVEARLAEITRDLEEASAQGAVARVRELGEEYAYVEFELAEHMREWEKLAG